MITLELAEEYIHYRKSLPNSNKSDDFVKVDNSDNDYIPIQIIPCPLIPKKFAYFEVICKYWDDKDSLWRTKNVHISIDKFSDWLELRRDQMISELV